MTKYIIIFQIEFISRMNSRVTKTTGIDNNIHNHLFYNNNNKTTINLSLNDSEGILNRYFNANKFKINQMSYNDLNDDIRNLLKKRQCYQFPCVQKIIERNKNIFEVRKKTLEEGCSVLKNNLYPRMKWIEAHSQLSNSKSLKVCKIPKVCII